MQKGNKFDYYYEKALNDDKFQEIFMEGLLGGLANVASSVQSGFQKGMKGQFIEPDKDKPDKPDKIGFKNKPKKGDIIISDKGGIRAKVISKSIDSDGQWDIQLFQNPDPKKQLSYFETTNPKYMDGVITTRDHLLLTHYDQGQQAPPQPPPQPPQPQNGDKVDMGAAKSGINTYDATTKQWVMLNGKPNPASALVNDEWVKQQTQNQPQNQKQKDYTITSGSGSEYPILTARVGFNTIYPTWYKEKEQLKNF
jgi:hypothetical protein